ncbi:DUF924 family protein [Lacimicrobium alkaliphilum]|uniref:DUF924 domain-containing protein n=1 Tax=Lacimicrobium alkaliphilum TaxID=1526571 RepID=A0A0U2Z5W4_9ALTE|nr:DUF924 family protein [Lacimicrobium alkaliphilum]ALS97860.1 hypothetical protein AT746_05955 [Lacimicrobium alkaliphilum]
MNNNDDQAVLEFWFGEISGELATRDKQKMWYASSAQTDETIRQQFGGLLQQADEGELEHWAYKPRGRLALILLFDQFSRNIYRGKPEAFAFDNKALALCEQGLACGQDKQLNLVERLFFYHPLEHAEDLQAQQQSVSLFAQLMNEYPDGPQYQAASSAHRYAVEHSDIIQRFGRFPHRNKVLGRRCTDEELAYLDQGGKRFGQ